MDLEEVSTDPPKKWRTTSAFSPFAIALAARKLWGHSLAEERDNRIAQENPEPRSLQAIRGHITRKLIAEIMPIIQSSRKVRGAQVKSSIHTIVARLGDIENRYKEVRMLKDADGPHGKLTASTILATWLVCIWLRAAYQASIRGDAGIAEIDNPCRRRPG